MTTPYVARRSDALDRPRVLSRLADEQPGFVEEPSVSGRMLPRPVPVPADFRHEVMFTPGVVPGEHPYIRAACFPCSWTARLPYEVSLTDLIRVTAQHAGVPDVTLLTTEALLDLLGVEVTK